MDRPAITIVRTEDLPAHAMEIKGIWAFSEKEILRKARITADGYSMAPWMHAESLAPVANMALFRYIVREAAVHDNELLVADSNAAFQNQPNPNYLYIDSSKIDLQTHDEDGDRIVYVNWSQRCRDRKTQQNYSTRNAAKLSLAQDSRNV